MRSSISACAVLLLALCAADTAVIHYTNGSCTVIVTVHRDRTVRSSSSRINFNSTTTLPQTNVSPLFSDVQAAQPLNKTSFYDIAFIITSFTPVG